MSLRFPYRTYPAPNPVWPLGGRPERPRPVVYITVIGPARTALVPALMDTGADDTVFEESLAAKVGIDLTNAPTGNASGVGMVGAPIRYAEVTLRLTDGAEFREWPARVGFTPAPIKRTRLGFAGFFQFFTATFDGEREQVELTVNTTYPGTRHAPPPPVPHVRGRARLHLATNRRGRRYRAGDRHAPALLRR